MSCSGNSSIKVMYSDGRIENVKNEINAPLMVGDSVVVEHYVILDSLYGFHSSDKVYGYYKGVLPDETKHYSSRRDYRIFYSVGVVIKN
jgi:hypothetical protein